MPREERSTEEVETRGDVLVHEGNWVEAGWGVERQLTTYRVVCDTIKVARKAQSVVAPQNFSD